MDVDPKYLDFAESVLETEFALSGDLLRARRRALAHAIERAVDLEVADLRAAEARRIIGIEARA